jgi:CubicO group peptidase (beta-lactamase class C family)
MSNPIQKRSLRRSTPEEQGMRSQELLAFLEALEAGKFNMHSFMLVRHGSVLAEGWWSPYDRACRRYVYSLSKSFTSTAVGFAVNEGLLKVDDNVVAYFQEDLPGNVSDNLRAMRVKDLLTMSTGHAIDSTLMILPRGLVNWAQAILSISVDYPPGTHFLYNTGASYLLSAIVQKASGQTVLDYLTPRFFEPLEISGVSWDTCPRGINTGGWGLSIRTEDLAKFGLFYLQKGNWNGKQILPAAWIEEATAAWVSNDAEERAKEPLDWRQGYGYQFWRCQHGAYRADGASGQFCVVMPEQDACLVITSETQDMQGILDLTWQLLLPAMKDRPFPSQPAAQERLRAKLASLQLVPPPAQPWPAMVGVISGKRFKIKDNGADIQSVTFSFEKNSCCFRLWDAAGEHQIVCGNGAWIRNEAQMPVMQPSMMGMLLSHKIQAAVKLAATGQWTDPQTYSMTWQYLETPHSNTVTCIFQGDELQMEVISSIADPANPFLMGKESRYTGTLEGEA